MSAKGLSVYHARWLCWDPSAVRTDLKVTFPINSGTINKQLFTSVQGLPSMVFSRALHYPKLAGGGF